MFFTEYEKKAVIMIGARNELKFYINSADAHRLNSRFHIALRKDDHTPDRGAYHIRSLYFEDPLSSAYFDKINGLEKRAKYRIRFYNRDLSYIRLEKKEKIGKKSFKAFETISLAKACALIKRKPDVFSAGGALEEEISNKILSEGFRPLLFVDYYRSAFLHPFGNVRITIDTWVSASAFRNELDEKTFSVPAIESGKAILEIKYDSDFPPYLSKLLYDIPKIPCAISKFCLCREVLY